MPYFTKSEAYLLAQEKLMNSGCSKVNTSGIIDGILDAEYSGIKSHGFHYLPIYCKHLKIGKVKGDASPSLIKVSNSAIKVNADYGFAHNGINLGFSSLFDMSEKESIACMSVYNSYNCGVLGFHTKRIAENGYLGLGFTNAPASIAPTGGISPVVGTNPFSLATPHRDGVAIIIDQSASVVAKSEISVRAKTGESIPEGWAFDSKGDITTDAKEALKGTMAPSGGYKGFGAGLLVEIFSACIAGGNLGTKASSFAGEDGGPPATGQFFIVLNPKKFNSHYEDSLNTLIESIISQENARIPGSKRIEKFKRDFNGSIEIKDDLLNRINEI